MPTKLIRVEEIFRSQVPDAGTLSDRAVTTTCPSCNARQSLGEATVLHEGTDTTYTCVNGCQPIVIISDPELRELPGRGHKYGSYLIRNVAELTLGVEGEQVTIPASPAALEALSGRTRKYRI